MSNEHEETELTMEEVIERIREGEIQDFDDLAVILSAMLQGQTIMADHTEKMMGIVEMHSKISEMLMTLVLAQMSGQRINLKKKKPWFVFWR